MSMRGISHRLGRFRRSERGASMAEFALVFPVFIALVLMTINVCMLLYGVTDLHFAAQKTARCIAMKSSDGVVPDNNCLDQAASLYTGPAIAAAFTHTTDGCGNTVTGTGSFTVITGLVNVPVSISASGCYPLQ
jgi:Flp pilus assembly protein TadG